MLFVVRTAQIVALTAFRDDQLDGGDLRLFQNDITPDENTVIGDLTIADFGGYADIVVANWGDPLLNPDGVPEIVMPSQQFNASGVAPSNMIYGFYYVNVGGDLLLAGRFDAGPIPMGTALDALVVQLRVTAKMDGVEATVSAVGP